MDALQNVCQYLRFGLEKKHLTYPITMVTEVISDYSLTEQVEWRAAGHSKPKPARKDEPVRPWKTLKPGEAGCFADDDSGEALLISLPDALAGKGPVVRYFNSLSLAKMSIMHFLGSRDCCLPENTHRCPKVRPRCG